MHRRLWQRILELVLIVGTAWYIGASLKSGWPLVLNQLDDIRWPYLAVAFLAFLGYFFARSIAWFLILKSLGVRTDLLESSKTWFTSELARYLPGNVWSFLGRVYLSSKQQVPKELSGFALILEVSLLTASAAILCISFVTFSPTIFLPGLRWFGLLLIPSAVILLKPELISRLVHRLFKRLKLDWPKLPIERPRLIVGIGVMTMAWLAYGIGSMWVTRSIIADLAVSPVWLIAVFIAAWLIGYLSIVTPMGLGVREGVVMASLSSIIGGPTAGLIAIATRLWLIVSELLSYIILMTISFIDKRVKRTWWNEHRFELILWSAIIGFIIYFGAYTSLRHYHFITARFDLGIMDQVVWNTAQGRFLELTMPTGTATVSRFFIHADPFLALLAPLYIIVSTPYAILLVQVVVVALGALPLYWLGKEVTKSKLLGLLVASGYLLFSPLQRAVIFDYHSVTLASAFLAYAFYFAYKRRYGWFIFFALLTLSTKETMTFLVAALGIAIIVKHKDWKVGVVTVGLSLLWFFLLFWQIMPHARGDGTTHFALGYYGYLGDSPGEIIKNLFLEPQRWLSVLFQLNQLGYLAYFVVPTAFFSIFSPVVLLALPEFAINMLSTQPEMHRIGYQYTSAITPFIFLSTIFGLVYWQKRLQPRFGQSTDHILAKILMVGTVLGIFVMSPFPLFIFADTSAFHYRFPAQQQLRDLAKTIPTQDSVAATNKLAPHFSQREQIYPFQEGHEIANWVIVELYQKHENLTAKQVIDAMSGKPYDRVLTNGTVLVYRRQ